MYAEEGTFAHSICEYKVKKYLHERVRRPQSEEFYTEELEQSTDAYYEFVVGVIEEMKRNGCEPLVLVEERVDYSHIAPSGFGTADMLIIGHDAEGRGILHICDYKNGKGSPKSRWRGIQAHKPDCEWSAGQTCPVFPGKDHLCGAQSSGQAAETAAEEAQIPADEAWLSCPLH